MSLALPLVVRTATRADVPALNTLIAASARVLSVGYYTPEQIDAAVTYVFGVDSGLVDDGTYFVVEMEGRDWSGAAAGADAARCTAATSDRWSWLLDWIRRPSQPASAHSSSRPAGNVAASAAVCSRSVARPPRPRGSRRLN